MPPTDAFDQPIGHSLPDWQTPPRPAFRTMAGYFCRLEPFKLERHADALHERHIADNDPAGWTYLAYGPFNSAADYRDWFARAEAGRDALFFAIVEPNTGQPVGVASYLRIDPPNGAIEVGNIHYTRALRRTPAATEAMALMMAHAFALGYRRYEWKCDALNAASRRAAERLGFRFEGVFRQHKIYKGRNRDTAWYSILDGEWPALDAAYRRWLARDNFDARRQQHRPLSVFMPEKSTSTGGHQAS